MTIPTVEELEAERLRPIPPRPGRGRMADEQLAAVLAEAAERPTDEQRFEDYRFCRDTGDVPAMAAHRAGLTSDRDRDLYERRYQRRKTSKGTSQ